MSSHHYITSQARPHRKLGRICPIFEPKQVGADLDRVPVSQVKGLMSLFRGYLRVAIVLEYGCLEYGTVSLCEVNNRIKWHLILYAADDNVIGKLAEPLVLDLLECR